ncbi:helix-turn-helix domain-containing protein [Saccharopolyspora spinosa]|uniref:Helix-turn-helix protein n=1 Tax=Saccharopolyspora spinosa TaxID=60894 RepID=A0A2N3Y6H2_SACSN|nr:helix-turn-helix transcriptional regulator [Saccharopolyspora spinosa]PKW18465.1 helix-turn-helix protein [Saccharopolyspora spinosa]
MSDTFGEALRRHRRAAGLSQADLAARLHLSQSDISRYERSQQQPTSTTAQALDETLSTRGQLRALATTNQQSRAVSLLGDELEALELARRVAASDVATETLDRLDVAFDELATAYASASPHDLLPRIREHLAYVGQLLDAPRLSLKAHRRLVVLGGWYSLLAATVHIDLNEHGPATATLRTAVSLAEHAGADEIHAWCYETEAWRTLTAGDYHRAVKLSQHAQHLAPAGSSAEVQATAQEGRAWARIGNAAATHGIVTRVHDLAAHRTTPDLAEHHFRYDPDKAHAYTATTLAWVGDSEGERFARDVIERFRPTGDGQRWPRRYASAHLDLALCAVRSGQLDEAADAARTAIDSGVVVPSNWWRAREVVQQVTAQRLPAARELQASYQAMTNGQP